MCVVFVCVHGYKYEFMHMNGKARDEHPMSSSITLHIIYKQS